MSDHGDDGDLVRSCTGYRTVMREGTFFSHSTAAALYGLPLPRGVLDHGVHVSSVLPSRAPKGKGVVGHALGRAPRLRSIRGFVVPEPVEVWCQLATQLSEDDLVLAGDALLRREHPLCEHHELTDAALAATARPGVRRLRAAVEHVRARTDSPMESVLRLAIIRAGLPEPEVNFAILNASGRPIASGDLVYPVTRLVIEYDGDHHRSDPVQYQTDIDRLYRIEALGWTVLRISKEHMRHDAREALRRIRDALKTSGPDTPRPPGW